MINLLDTLGASFSRCLQAQLISPLEAGQWYCVSFYVSLAVRDSSYANTQGASYSSKNATDRIGAYFSAARPGDELNPAQFLGLTPQVVNPTGNWLDDTTGWTRITGIFKSTGGEQWITISNFDQNPQINPVSFAHPPYLSIPFPLYFIDDVNVNKITIDSASQHNPATGAQDTIICDTGILYRVLYAPSGADVYIWSNGATTPSINITQGGTYWYSAIYSGCGTISDTIHITYKQTEALELGNDTALCFGNVLKLSANDSFEAYHWNTGDGTANIRVSQTGTYILTTSDVCGSQTDSVKITFYPLPAPPEMNDTFLCRFDDPIVLSAGRPELKWYQVSTGGTASSAPPITTSDTGIYHLFVSQSEHGCEGGRATVTVNVIAAPTIELDGDMVFCPGDEPLIGLLAPDDTMTQYRWNDGTSAAALRPETSGLYVLEAFNSCGAATDSIRVRFDECLDCVWVPNAFSPNGDGLNDLFGALIKCPIENYRLLIFNRWGQKVFESYKTSNTWDGSNQDTGTYFYSLSYRNKSNNQIMIKKGNVALLR